MKRYRLFVADGNGKFLMPLDRVSSASLQERLNDIPVLTLSMPKSVSGSEYLVPGNKILVSDVSLITSSEEAVITNGDLIFTEIPSWCVEGEELLVRSSTKSKVVEVISRSGTTVDVLPSLVGFSTDTVLVSRNHIRSFSISSVSETRETTEVMITVTALGREEELRRIPLLLVGGLGIIQAGDVGSLDLGTTTIDGALEILDEPLLEANGFWLNNAIAISEPREVSSSATDTWSYLVDIANLWSTEITPISVYVTEAGKIMITTAGTSDTFTLRFPRFNLASLSRNLDYSQLSNNLIVYHLVDSKPVSDQVQAKNADDNRFTPSDSIRLRLRPGDLVTISDEKVSAICDGVLESNGKTVVFLKVPVGSADRILDSVVMVTFPDLVSLSDQTWKVKIKKTSLYYAGTDPSYDYLNFTISGYPFASIDLEGETVDIIPVPVQSSLTDQHPSTGNELWVLSVRDYDDYSAVDVAFHYGLNVPPHFFVGKTLSIVSFPDSAAANIRGDKVVIGADRYYDTGWAYSVSRWYYTLYVTPPFPVEYNTSKRADVTFGRGIVSGKWIQSVELSSSDEDGWEFYLAHFSSDYLRFRIFRRQVSTPEEDIKTLFNLPIPDTIAGSSEETMLENYGYSEDSEYVLGHLIVTDSDDESLYETRKKVKFVYSSWFLNPLDSGTTPYTSTGSWSGSILTDTSPPSTVTDGMFAGFTLSAGGSEYTIVDNYTISGTLSIVIAGSFSSSGSGSYTVSRPVVSSPHTVCPMYFDIFIKRENDDWESTLLSAGNIVDSVIMTNITPAPFKVDLDDSTIDLSTAWMQFSYNLGVGWKPIGSLIRDVSEEIQSEISSGSRLDSLMLEFIDIGCKDRVGISWTGTLDEFLSTYMFEEDCYVFISERISGVDKPVSINRLAKVSEISLSGGYIWLKFESSLPTSPVPGSIVMKASLPDSDSISAYGEKASVIKVNDIFEPKPLIRYARDTLADVSSPLATYSISGVDLKLVLGDDAEDIEVGSSCRVIDTSVGLDATLVCLSKSVDLLSPEMVGLTVSNEKKKIGELVANLEIELNRLRCDFVRYKLVTGTEKCVFFDKKLRRCMRSRVGTLGYFCESSQSARDGAFRSDGLPIGKSDCPWVTYDRVMSTFSSTDGSQTITASGVIKFSTVVGTDYNDGWKPIYPLSFVTEDDGVDFTVRRVWLSKQRVMDVDNPGYEGDYDNTLVRVKTDDNGEVSTQYTTEITNGTNGTFSNSVSPVDTTRRDGTYRVSGPGVTIQLSGIDEEELVGWWIWRVAADGSFAEGQPIIDNEATDGGYVRVYVENDWDISSTTIADWVIGLPSGILTNNHGFVIELNVPVGSAYDVTIEWQADGYRYE